MHTNRSSKIDRFNPSYKVGLSLRQVRQRKKQKQNQRRKKTITKDKRPCHSEKSEERR